MNLRLLLVVLAIPLLVLIYWLLKPDAAGSAPAPARAANVLATQLPAANAPPHKVLDASVRTLEWKIAKGEIVQAPANFSVQQGDTVRLSITSDQPDTLHIHGYDLTAKVTPETSTEVSLLAQHSGRFEIELHHSGLELGALEVLPK